MPEKKAVAEFIAYFPPIQSAIKRGADGMRITLDIPETEVVNALKLLAWTKPDCPLRVTIEPVQKP